MTGLTDLDARPDLTRWNRAGLNQVQYLDGNAATYLEDLRLALRQQFAGNDEVLSWLDSGQPLDPALADKTLRDWQRRLRDQYGGARRDYAWEMLRSFARATHVLTHTVNAYANERYINTATQWDNLRRLVNMLDYHPAPPASAETWVALIAKTPDPDKGIVGIGTVAAGLALQNQPKDGSSPLIFETLQELALDYRLNELRAPDYNRAQQSFSLPVKGQTVDFPLQAVPDAVTVGEYALLTCSNAAVAVAVSAIGADYLCLTIVEEGFSGAQWPLADVRLQLAPAWQEAPRLNGSNVVAVSNVSSNVSAGSVLAYEVSASNWALLRVSTVDGERIALTPTPPNGVSLSLCLQANKQTAGFILPLQRAHTQVWRSDLTAISPTNHSEAGVAIYSLVAATESTNIYYLPAQPPVAFSVVNTSPESLEFAGKPGDLSSGGWILLHTQDRKVYSYRLSSVTSLDKAYRLSVSGLANNRWVLAQGLFATSLVPRGYDQNLSPIYHSASGSSCQLDLLLPSSTVPAALTPGRVLWVVGSTQQQRVTVQTILPLESAANGGWIRLSVAPSLAGLSLPKYATRIYANVVLAGHGETRGQTVLGNGNRIEPNQEFIYRKTDLAFEQDNQFVSGVRAAVTVLVDERRWTQVDNLRDSEAADTHFEATLTEDDQLLLRFGDGIHGQRLPTGTNNLLIQGRFGSGTQGNLPAGSLNKLKKPHLLVESVLQPAAATGGGDRESGESLRSQAPASVLTLDRAVTVADYGHIARRHASIWQARSHALPATARASDRVEVVLVPAGGGAVSQELAGSMKTYLEGFSRPGVLVSIKSYQAILLDIELTLRVDITAYDGNQIAEIVRLTLLDSFSLSKAVLAEPLYLSRLYQVVESVEGVENVALALNPLGFVDENGLPVVPADAFYGADNSLRRISPAPHQLIYLNSQLLAPEIHWEAAYV